MPAEKAPWRNYFGTEDVGPRCFAAMILLESETSVRWTSFRKGWMQEWEKHKVAAGSMTMETVANVLATVATEHLLNWTSNKLFGADWKDHVEKAQSKEAVATMARVITGSQQQVVSAVRGHCEAFRVVHATLEEDLSVRGKHAADTLVAESRRPKLG